MKKKCAIKVKYLLVSVVTAIHETIVNTAIPMQVTALVTLSDPELPSGGYVAPIIVLIGFAVYPIIIYMYLDKNMDKIRII